MADACKACREIAKRIRRGRYGKFRGAVVLFYPAAVEKDDVDAAAFERDIDIGTAVRRFADKRCGMGGLLEVYKHYRRVGSAYIDHEGKTVFIGVEVGKQELIGCEIAIGVK